MRRTLQIVVGVTIAALLGLAVWGCFGLTRHLIVAVDKFGDAGAGLAETTAKLNGKHGTIAMADEDVGAVKSLIIHADLVARHEQQSLATWDADGTLLFTNLNGGVTDLRGTINAATKTTDAATELTQALTADAKTADTTIAAAQPVLIDIDGAARDLRAITPEVKRTATATADTMGHVDGIAADGQAVADHYTQIIINPKKSPWYIQMLPSAIRVAIEAALDKWSMSK